MKVIIAFAALVAVALAAPQSSDKDAVVIRSDLENIGVDGYNYAYETSNGIAAQETGQVINSGAENEAVVARGQFSYTGPDGVVYNVQYTADENGFQPVGAHIPA
ncbi:flexible cuticle protein 12-like [Anoplophora glabripennis]|uniref:flexible cuticle protein 12-like n=1 Tax=Anoplophora glabripennis TaxID=217634 RepID=UPI00087426B2|nr:flexible cuticle protein 12-like [Anoplophora glabripennis]